jgi:hypothetical protein
MALLQFPIVQPQFNSLPYVYSAASFSLPPVLLWGIFLAIMAFYIIFSLIFVYHWKKYAFDFFASAKAYFIYFSVSGLLIITILSSLIVYLD